MLRLLLLLLALSRPRPQPDEIKHDLFCGVSLTRSRGLIKYAPPGCLTVLPPPVWTPPATRTVSRSQGRRRSLSLRFDQYRTPPNSSSRQRVSVELAYPHSTRSLMNSKHSCDGCFPSLRRERPNFMHVSFYFFYLFKALSFSTFSQLSDMR